MRRLLRRRGRFDNGNLLSHSFDRSCVWRRVSGRHVCPENTACGWMTPDWGLPLSPTRPEAAPRRTWTTWRRRPWRRHAGRGVQAKPNNGRPENQLPYTPFGLELYKSHKALEGADAVKPADGNDPRNLCEPLGMPRTNHYNLGLTQIFQDDHKVAVLYQYDNRWRVIWTDGRQLPTLVDGGVELGGELREQRFVRLLRRPLGGHYTSRRGR